jgi:hypothetical protein
MWSGVFCSARRRSIAIWAFSQQREMAVSLPRSQRLRFFIFFLLGVP